MDLNKVLLSVSERAKYVLMAKHRKGHGLHSPFIFDLVTKVFNDKTEHPQFKIVENIVSAFLKDKSRISFKELGGGSRKLKNNSRKIADIARYASVSKKYGRLLFRISRYYNPEIILEIGTSLGISTFYMAQGNNNSIIHTLEGNPDISKLAEKAAVQHGINNIRFHIGLFDDVLPDILSNIPAPALAFIDGNHTYEATLVYFRLIKARMKEGIIVLDDIYWSAGMKKAWEEIKMESTVSIDLYKMGIVIVNEFITPAHYRIRF